MSAVEKTNSVLTKSKISLPRNLTSQKNLDFNQKKVTDLPNHSSQPKSPMT
jgi:hypothetical protein